MSEPYTLPENFPQPTVYASLMDVAIKVPVEGWEQEVAKKVGLILDTFENLGLDHLRKAYVAGVQDGYRQALIELEKGRA